MSERTDEVHGQGTKAEPASVSRWLIRNGIRYKKALMASEQDCPDVWQARDEWQELQQPKMKEATQQLVFVDETSTNAVGSGSHASTAQPDTEAPPPNSPS